MKLLIFLLMFFVIGALVIIGNNDLEMHRAENLEKFADLYSKWIDSLYSNFQGITGNAIKMEWMPR